MSVPGVDSPGAGEIAEYHLTWNNYNSSLISFLKHITPIQDFDSSLSDVTLSCAGQKNFQAHRLVLVTCSTYFRHIFLSKGMVGDKSSCPGHPIVYIPDLSEEVLELILGFMYKGEITVPSHLIIPLMEAARLLGVQGLTEPSDSSSSSDSLTSPKSGAPEYQENHGSNGNMENLTEDPEHSNNLVIDTKHDSEPEDLSQTDSEESDRRSSKLDFSSFNGDHNLQVTSPDSTKSLFPKSSFPTLTPLPSPLALTAGLNLTPTRGYPTSSSRRSSKSPRLLSPSSTSAAFSGDKIRSYQDASRSYPDMSRSYTTAFDPTRQYTGTQDPSRPFACSICPKRFRMKHHLKEHNLIHSGEMPFSCHLCPKRFNRSYTLKNHMKLHSTSQNGLQEGVVNPGLIIPLLSQPPSFP
ncbi:zinc finger E-box-binding homeobox 2 [Eurytemora carolleeae]|uniref:zinc finger E-box-binding homeobox 2 n=1 Tax=Eurytemora carolleeae TaxID=1294199 RepID=UPI000C756915|nr:zinc finger E-box-binding homeobox 2 [Eurytemora carolleeae]|eukprot:XP_023345247.1 zinc finger E-box-binding homeobox 2-like [Eurytemora affinis]